MAGVEPLLLVTCSYLHEIGCPIPTTAFGSVVRKPKSSSCPSTGALFGPRTPRQGVQRPAKANSGRSSLKANHFGVLRGFVSAYSQNDVAGTMQRFCLPSPPRQCGLPTLRILMIGAPTNCGGPGIPQRAMTSSRSPSAPLRTIGAIWSGKLRGTTAGARSIIARAKPVADRGLAFGQTVEIAHCGGPL